MSYNNSSDARSIASIYIYQHLKTNLIPARKAFRKIVVSIQRALEGTLAPAFYLVGMDCGGGKSTFIKDMLRSYKQVGFQPDTGILVALHTLDGVEDFATTCGLGRTDYAVFTGKEKLNAFGLGMDRANGAPVLFTTQQMALARMARYGSFRAIEEFHFKGRPRNARIWDESLNPAEGIAIGLDTLQLLPSKLRKPYPAFVAIVDDLLAAMHNADARTPIIIPNAVRDEAAPIIATFKELPVTKLTGDEAETVRRLSQLAGRTVGIERGMQNQLILLGVTNPLPADFMPVFVFDASVRLRAAYRLMEEHRGNVVRLAEVVHSYTDTTIHLCKISTGTDKLADHTHRAKLLAVAADLINADPDEDWLVIHHMAKAERYDIKGELSGLLNLPRQASFVHWGDHYASNEYRHIRKVIVIGMWRKPGSVYVAQIMAASGLGYDAVTPERRLHFRQAEQDHDLMQGIGRSHIRNANDGQAGQATVYMFATSEQGLEDRIRGVFPGCTVLPWEPVDRAASGHLAALIAYLDTMMVQGSVEEVSKRAVAAALGISRSQGLRNVTKDKRFDRYLRRSGIVMQRFKFVKQAD